MEEVDATIGGELGPDRGVSNRRLVLQVPHRHSVPGRASRWQAPGTHQSVQRGVRERERGWGRGREMWGEKERERERERGYRERASER